MSWIGDTEPPSLDLSSTNIPAVVDWRATVTFQGTITDTEGHGVSVFAVIDSDYSRLCLIIDNMTTRTFQMQRNVRDDLQIPIGVHEIAVYAIDQTGTVSRDQHKFTVNVQGPTITKPNTPFPTLTPTAAPTATTSRSPFETRTRSQSPAPSGTPVPYYIMAEELPGWRQNFVLIGHPVGDDATVIRMTHSGVETVVKDAYGDNYLSNKEALLTSGGIYAETQVTLMGAAALIVLNLTNQLTSSQNVDAAIMIDLYVNGNDHAPCFDFAQHTGFAAYGDYARVNFWLKEHRLVTDVSSYWFGPWNNRTANQWLDSTYDSFGGADTAMSLSWKGQYVPAGGRLVLSTLITWGTGSGEPVLLIDSNLSSPVNWATTFAITGTATDPESGTVTIIAVPDDDYARLKVLGRNIQASARFSYPLRFQDFNVRNGQHHLDVYAVDVSGTVSAPVRFIATVVAPTLPVTQTPPRTPLPSSTGGVTRSRTLLPTRTAFPTPPAMRSPPGDLRMVVERDVDSHTNFRLQGETPQMPGDVIHVTNTGWVSRYFLSTGQSGRLARLEPAVIGDLFIGTRVTPIGASAVIAFEILNFGSTPITLNLSLDADVNLAENDDAPIHTLDEANGFRIEGGLFHFRIYTKGYPLVSDADAFWFGSFFELEDHLWDQVRPGSFRGDDSACSITWQNRVIPAQGRTVLSTLMTWYGDSSPPTLNMGSTNLPARIDWMSPMTFSGTVSQADGNNIHLALVMNDDFGFILPFGQDLRSGTSFSYAYTPAELFLFSGTHSFQIYAFDQRGAVAQPVTFTIDVLAPTMQPTWTPWRTPTRTRSFQANTPNPTLDPNGGSGDGAGSGGASVAGGDNNGGAKAAIGVLLPISIIIILVVAYLIFCKERGGFGGKMDTTVDLNEVGSYTI
jgi:hypothetical protein